MPAFVDVIIALLGRLLMTSWYGISRRLSLAIVWTLPVHALALDQVRYRCGSLGEVSVDRSMADPISAVIV